MLFHVSERTNSCRYWIEQWAHLSRMNTHENESFIERFLNELSYRKLASFTTNNLSFFDLSVLLPKRQRLPSSARHWRSLRTLRTQMPHFEITFTALLRTPLTDCQPRCIKATHIYLFFTCIDNKHRDEVTNFDETCVYFGSISLFMFQI